MRAAVIGGAGIAGSYAVEALGEAGDSVELLSRRTGVDLYSGEGLDGALAGVDVVVDALNITSMRRSVAEDFFTTTARRLQDAAHAHGVRHIVVLSIVGIDRVRGNGYYTAKLAQERVMAEGAVPTTVLRATQFHEFAAQLLRRSHAGRFAIAPHMRSQPVAARTVGRHLARLASERPGGIVELAGPDIHDVADLARRYLRARDERLRVIAVPLPGKAGNDIRAGALLGRDNTIVDGPTYDDWLRSDDALRLPLVRDSGTRSARSDVARTA
jgi:uncharacterized protein YbjT (DUF2867 family)